MCESKQYIYKIPAIYQRYNSINQVKNLFAYCYVKNLIVTQVSNPRALFFLNHLADSQIPTLVWSKVQMCSCRISSTTLFFFHSIYTIARTSTSFFTDWAQCTVFRATSKLYTQNITIFEIFPQFGCICIILFRYLFFFHWKTKYWKNFFSSVRSFHAW